MKYHVIDMETGETPDERQIALTEEWAKYLIYCDMDGFALRPDGSLILLDDDGNTAVCPRGRFQVKQGALNE